jgi:RHS repeat-associated protein
MRKLNESIKVLLFSLLSIGAVTAYADKPALPPGLAKYVMVLWPAGTPIPGDPKGTVKNVPEPDIEKLGGKLLFKHENRRVILLPLGQAKGLRKHQSVVYLQRIWMGESLDGWDETYPSSSASGLVPKAKSDENLQWGPKSYQYDGSGNIKQIGSDQYTYDSAGRLVSAQVSGATIATKTETYSYDAFGNLIGKGVTGANPVTIPVDGASNRLLGVSYDAAGNVTTADDERRRYSWDSLNTLSRVHPSIGNERRMIYDASDERLATYLVGDSLTRWTFRDFEGHIVREFEGYHYGPGSWYFYWDQDNFYGEGTLMAGESQPWQYSSSAQYGGPRHYHLDHLGSVRMVTNGANPGRSLSEHDYFPFGTTATRTYQEQLDWANNHIDAMRFAGHWRDYLGLLNVDNTEYIDYMHARHYDPTLGRFLSVDPAMNMGLATQRPQSWNRYSYVADNPINRIDPTGLDWFHVGDTWEWHKGHKYKNLQGYRYLMVATSTGKKNKAGATMFNVKLYDQKNVMFTGTGWSGGNGHPRIPAHNYNLFGSRTDPMPTTVANPPSRVWAGNPPPAYGIQEMPAFIGQYAEQASYGPIRARLNPTMPVDVSIDGAYYHGQDPIRGSFDLGTTHGCLCYGNDTSIIQYIFDHKIDVHVAVDVPVQEP